MDFLQGSGPPGSAAGQVGPGIGNFTALVLDCWSRWRDGARGLVLARGSPIASCLTAMGTGWWKMLRAGTGLSAALIRCKQ